MFTLLEVPLVGYLVRPERTAEQVGAPLDLAERQRPADHGRADRPRRGEPRRPGHRRGGRVSGEFGRRRPGVQPSAARCRPGRSRPSCAGRRSRVARARARRRGDGRGRRAGGGHVRQPRPAGRPSRPDRRACRRRVLRERDERVVGADLPDLPVGRPRHLAPGRRRAPEARRRWAAGNYWAPELVRWSGRMLAFYSASRARRDAVHRRRERRAARGPVARPRAGAVPAGRRRSTSIRSPTPTAARWLLFKRLGIGPRHLRDALQRAPAARGRPRARGSSAPDAPGSRASPRGRTSCCATARYYLFLRRAATAAGRRARYAEGVARAPALLGPYTKAPPTRC